MRHASRIRSACAAAGARSGRHYHWRKRGEYHQINPETVSRDPARTRANSLGEIPRVRRLVNDRNRNLAPCAALLKFKPKGSPIPLDEVEPGRKS
jgi:glutamate synthase (NADPH) large chain